MLSVAFINLEPTAHFAFLYGPLGLTEGGTLLAELLVAAVVVGAVVWQYRRRRGKR